MAEALGEKEKQLRVVVQAIQSLASLMGMELAAKSVDTRAVFQSLQEIGVTYGVGEYLGSPRPDPRWAK